MRGASCAAFDGSECSNMPACHGELHEYPSSIPVPLTRNSTASQGRQYGDPLLQLSICRTLHSECIESNRDVYVQKVRW